MKYVILMQQVGGPQGMIQLFPVLFPETLSHYEVASQPHNGKRATPVAAGFVYFKPTGHGMGVNVPKDSRSTSLMLRCGPFDQDIIEDVLFGGNPINFPTLWTEHSFYRDNFHRFSWDKLDRVHFRRPQAEGDKIKCPHCGDTLLWSEDRGAHCDGCDDFDPEKDLPAPTTAASSEVPSDEFVRKCKRLLDGGPFDLQDSPLSFMDNVREFVRDYDVAMQSTRQNPEKGKEQP